MEVAAGRLAVEVLAVVLVLATFLLDDGKREEDTTEEDGVGDTHVLVDRVLERTNTVEQSSFLGLLLAPDVASRFRFRPITFTRKGSCYSCSKGRLRILHWLKILNSQQKNR